MSALPVPSPEIGRRRGFSPLPNEVMLDWARLIAGNVQVFSILYINSEIHVPRDKGTPPPKWSRPITHAELTVVCRCTIRAVETKLKDLVDRKVIESKRTPEGNCYRIPFDTWPDLPDMPSEVVSIADGKPVEDSVDNDQTEDRPKDGIIHEFETKRLKAGKKSRPSNLPQAAEKVQYEPDTDGVLVSERMIDGVLIAKIIVKECIEKAKGEQTVKPQKIAVAARISPSESTSLHTLLDDYCLRHHGTIPNNKLLAQIQKALGKATIRQFERVLKAKIRTGKPISMGLLINLAGDAALAADRAEPIEYDPMGRPRRKTTG